MWLGFIFCLVLSGLAFGQDFQGVSETYKAQVLTESLRSPWAIQQGPEGHLYITEKNGRIIKYNLEGQRLGQLQGLPSSIAVVGQGGLLDMAFHPNFDEKPWVFLTYSTRDQARPRRGINTRLSRFTLNGNRLEDEVVYLQGAKGTDGAHFGSRLAIQKNKYLFTTFGERHNKHLSQDLSTLNGKVTRLLLDGSLPQDNPFIQQEGAQPAIYSLGHRNPQGIDVHPVTQDIFISEHGPSGYDARLPGHGPVGKADEVNLLVPGGNYGWPWIFGDPSHLPWTAEMFHRVEELGLIMPYREYSIPDGIAPSGVAFYKGDQFPSWKNSLFVSALRGYLLRVETNEEGEFIVEEQLIPSGFARVRDVTAANDGNLYFITGGGQLVRISK